MSGDILTSQPYALNLLWDNFTATFNLLSESIIFVLNFTQSYSEETGRKGQTDILYMH